jgi:hypothetical protein
MCSYATAAMTLPRPQQPRLAPVLPARCLRAVTAGLQFRARDGRVDASGSATAAPGAGVFASSNVTRCRETLDATTAARDEHGCMNRRAQALLLSIVAVAATACANAGAERMPTRPVAAGIVGQAVMLGAESLELTDSFPPHCRLTESTQGLEFDDYEYDCSDEFTAASSRRSRSPGSRSRSSTAPVRPATPSASMRPAYCGRAGRPGSILPGRPSYRLAITSPVPTTGRMPGRPGATITPSPRSQGRPSAAVARTAAGPGCAARPRPDRRPCRRSRT